ncbi:rCG35988 [Rattus norvegicus]|uniref:RCG35988 n=1 Tax=Rattus norvegicus TaxID=10116 RepID=A6IJZ5_RAT|nr:rCG35988 [Rattus norvegicus]
MSSALKKPYSKTLLQRRKFSSRSFSRGRSAPNGRAKRGSFSKVEKMVFCKHRAQGANLKANGSHGTVTCTENQTRCEEPHGIGTRTNPGAPKQQRHHSKASA